MHMDSFALAKSFQVFKPVHFLRTVQYCGKTTFHSFGPARPSIHSMPRRTTFSGLLGYRPTVLPILLGEHSKAFYRTALYAFLPFAVILHQWYIYRWIRLFLQ